VKGKKQALSRLMYVSGLWVFLNYLSRGNLAVFNYHRIRTDSLEFRTAFDDAVFGPNRSEFKRQLIWLKRNTHLVTEAELLEVLYEGKAMPRNAVLITFDDGYRDNFDLAFPLLKELNIPAIFFIPTLLIDERQLGWWDTIAYLVKKSKKSSIRFRGRNFDIESHPREAIRFFQEIMKSEKAGSTECMLEELSQVCEVEMPGIEEINSELMTWDNLRELASHGMALGTHTHSHRVLSTLEPNEQKEEMIKSKRILEETIGKKVNSIAYPVGNYAHIDLHTHKVAKECGFRLGFSFNTGINRWEKITPLDIRRTSAPNTLHRLVATYFFPKIFT